MLIPLLIGGVLRLARQSFAIDGKQMAAHLDVPPSTITKLELGVITTSAYLLDMYALVVSREARRIEGPRAPSWRGWELLRAATEVADSMEKAGYVTYWIAPTPDLDEDQFLRGKPLLRLIASHWPKRFASRLRA